jgi:dienelactone hydrolase
MCRIIPGILIFLIGFSFAGSDISAGRDAGEITLRGKNLDIFYYPGIPSGKNICPAVLFFPGDGGWRGFAISLAESLAERGYDVYGVDTLRYLTAFTGERTMLTPHLIMGDFHAIGEWIRSRSPSSITLLGWSEGAGLALAAAAADSNKGLFNGLVLIGLNTSTVLGWKTIDDLTWLTKKDPNEPKFASAEYMPQAAPLPLIMIQSSGDEYISVAEARRLFDRAVEPKQFHLVNARDHHFKGGEREFFNTLGESMAWVRTIRK